MSRALVPAAGEVVGRQPSSGVRMWALALVVGASVGLVVVVARFLISYIEFWIFGTTGPNFATNLANTPWYLRWIGPVIGGVLVALLLLLASKVAAWGPNPRPFGLSDVIGARKLRGPLGGTTLSLSDSMMSLLISVVSLGSGASAGREEPMLHAGASLGLLPGRILALSPGVRRMLIGMGVAAAFAAILHAPLAATLLARELVLKHTRLAQLAPVGIAAAIGWLISAGAYGPAIEIPAMGEIPNLYHFMSPLVALVAALIGVGAIWLWSVGPRTMDGLVQSLRIPAWTMPMIGGALTGVIAIAFPQAIGIGYPSLTAGLGGGYAASLMLVLVLAKIGAALVAFAFRFGGGRIGPALYIGAMLGSALGVFLGLMENDQATAQVYFGVIAMVAIFAAITDAPLAAALLGLELSGSVAIGAAALVCAQLAAVLRRKLMPVRDDAEELKPLGWR